MNNEIKSNSIVFAGPFMGEFGWELSHWAPHVRWLRDQYRSKRLIVSSYPGREPLYHGIADEFWPLPDWFVSEGYDCDCFEALSTVDHYAKLLIHFKNELIKKFNPENVMWTKPPRGMKRVLRDMKQVTYQKLEASVEANGIADKLISDYGNKPVVAIFARNVKRNMFLDINTNANCFVEDHYPGGLPTRNWPRSHWNDLFKMLHTRFGGQFTFAIGGTKDGNCLLENAQLYNDVINLTEFDITQSLDVTIAMLNKAFLSVSSQSGPTHLSVQCGCPSFVYGHEPERHARTDNPLNTDVMFLETKLGLYNDSPEQLYKEISVYLDILMRESSAGHQISNPRGDWNICPTSGGQLAPISQKVKKIGVVGVFDNPESTNIPFAKAFRKLGFDVEIFDYRTVASQIGIEKMNDEIKKFAPSFDLIIICKGNGIYPGTIEACSSPQTKVCWYMMDAKIHLDKDASFYDMATAADFSVVAAHEVALALREASIKNVHHIIQGIDPTQFRSVECEKLYDVVFIGQSTEKRKNILRDIDAVNTKGFFVKPYGPGFSNSVYGEDFNKACSEGRILLAINNTDSDQDSFSDRILRYMATKGCVVTEYSNGLEKYFVNGKHLAWPVGKETLADVIKKYLDHPKMMGHMAENGYQYVLENHTWSKVAEKIIELTEGL